MCVPEGCRIRGERVGWKLQMGPLNLNDLQSRQSLYSFEI